MYEFLRVVSFYACKAQILPETTARSPLLRVGAETRPCITSREMGSKTDIQGKALSLFFFSLCFSSLLPAPFHAGGKAGTGV